MRDPLSQCIEREREAVRQLSCALTDDVRPCTYALHAARAATDEAVRAVEGLAVRTVSLAAARAGIVRLQEARLTPEQIEALRWCVGEVLGWQELHGASMADAEKWRVADDALDALASGDPRLVAQSVELPLYCPECDHPTAANGMCFQCHPIEGASPRYEARPCEYRTTRRHSEWCPWVERNTTTPAPTAQGESTGGGDDV